MTQINTLYSLGEEVYYLYDNRIEKGEVTKIDVTCIIAGGKETHFISYNINETLVAQHNLYDDVDLLIHDLRKSVETS